MNQFNQFFSNFLSTISNSPTIKSIKRAVLICPELAAVTAETAIDYARYINRNKTPDCRIRFELGEAMIATNFYFSYHYALIIQDRFKLGEVIFSEDPFYSYAYAYNVLNDRFELGEPAILTNPHFTEIYCTNILDKRYDYHYDGKSFIFNT